MKQQGRSNFTTHEWMNIYEEPRRMKMMMLEMNTSHEEMNTTSREVQLQIPGYYAIVTPLNVFVTSVFLILTS